MHKQRMRKITVTLPQDLVEQATKASGKAVTHTIREGLEKVLAAEAYQQIRRLRGKVKLSINVDEMREDYSGLLIDYDAARSPCQLRAKELKAKLADTLIAQLCIDHEMPLITRDRDFFTFPEILRSETAVINWAR
jgi:predicted nucleic acid-binding protein